MTCAICGAVNAEGSRFCSSCGASIVSPTPVSTTGLASKSAPASHEGDPSGPPRRRGLTFITVLAVMLLMMGALAGAWWLLQPQRDGSASTKAPQAAPSREVRPLATVLPNNSEPEASDEAADNPGFVTIDPNAGGAIPSSESPPTESPGPDPSASPDDGMSIVNPSPAPTPSVSGPSDPLALDEGGATAALMDLRDGALPLVMRLEQKRWYPQLSSKCSALTEGDFGRGPGIGVPEGKERAYPDGIGTARILALDTVYRNLFPDKVATVLHADVRRDPPNNPSCLGTDMWITMYIGDSFANADDVLEWCRDNDLPRYECGARWVGNPPKGVRY